MVCYSLGAINSLLVKMDALMENHPMMKGLLQDIKSIRDDLLNKFSRGRITSQQITIETNTLSHTLLQELGSRVGR